MHFSVEEGFHCVSSWPEEHGHCKVCVHPEFFIAQTSEFLNSFAKEQSFFLFTGMGKGSPVIIQWNNQLSSVGVASVVSKYCSNISVNPHSRKDSNSYLCLV